MRKGWKIAIAFVAIGLTAWWRIREAHPLYVRQCADWKGERFSPDERVRGCTEAIQSGRYRDKNRVWPYLNRAIAFAAKGQYDRAIQDYDEAIKFDPKNAVTFNDRGVAYAAKAEYDRAIQDYDDAIGLNPKYANAFNNRGKVYAVIGQYDRAIQDYDDAIGLSPKITEAFENRGNVYAYVGQPDRAIQDYDQTIRLDPKHAEAFKGRGDVYGIKGRYDRAIRDYDEAIRLNPKYADAFIKRGRAHFYVGALAKALADLNQASELAPKDAYVALWLDIASRRAKMPSRLDQTISQIDMSKWPAPILRFYLGQLTPAAVVAAADDPNSKVKAGQVCEANFYAGELSLNQGERDEATRLLRLAAADCPKNFVEYFGAVAELNRLGH